MNRFTSVGCVIVLALSVCLPGPVVGQDTDKKKTLVINGRSAAGAVVQIDSHSYVDVDALAQMTNASLRIQPDRIILTMPVSNAGPASEAATQISKNFAMAGIALLAEMREWKVAIAGVLRMGVAAGTWLGPYLQNYRIRAEGDLEQASVAATTAADRRALQLLRNEFNNLRNWDSQSQASIQALNAEQSISPAAAENDPLLAKISGCGNFLESMMVGREFADNPNCH